MAKFTSVREAPERLVLPFSTQRRGAPTRAYSDVIALRPNPSNQVDTSQLGLAVGSVKNRGRKRDRPTGRIRRLGGPEKRREEGSMCKSTGARGLALLLAIAVVFSVSIPAAALPPVPERLGRMEQLVYGEVRKDTVAIGPRLEALERDILGEVQSASNGLLYRLQQLESRLDTMALGGSPSLRFKLNAVEWVFFQTLSSDKSLLQRLDEMETKLYGEKQSGSLMDRVDRLVREIWPSGNLNAAQQVVPAGKLVRVRLLSEIDSSRNRVGDVVDYEVVESVYVNDYVVIPQGVRGRATVSHVTKESGWGKDGKVELTWGSVPAIDGQMIELEIGEAALERNVATYKDGQRGAELATGASIVGAILLAPIGLAPVGLLGGGFVGGQKHYVRAGTELFVQVGAQCAVTGLSIKPVISDSKDGK